MADEQNIPTHASMTPEEKQAQKKRIMWVLVIGTVSLVMFYYLANGVTSLLTESTAVDPAEVEQITK